MTFPSKISYGLLGFIFLVFFGPLVPAAVSGNLDTSLLGTVALLVLTYGFILYLFFTTRYTVTGSQLHIRCGFIRYRPVNLEEITSIKSTSSLLAAPAASLDRLKIKYQGHKSAIVSPKDKAGFIKALQEVNATIEEM